MNDGFPAFSPKAVHVLQQLLNKDTTIILTTSHKMRFSVDQWKLIFEKRGLYLEKLKSLDQNSHFRNRKEEVMNWFNLNNVKEDFLIIDDDKSLNDLPYHLKRNLILTSPMIGLTESHLEEIRSLLPDKI